MPVSKKPVEAKIARELIVEQMKKGGWSASKCCVGTTSQDHLRSRLDDFHCVPVNAIAHSCPCTSPEEAERAYRLFVKDGCEDGGQDDIVNANVVYVYLMVPGTQP